MSLLRLTDVSFRYPGAPAVLDGISVEARDAALVAVVGPNGAGKSTLLDVVAGLKRPRRASVW
ncbi:MAG: ATP-binding cassette domain-containing protein [Bryobacterales bacterium]|nr:ATP-binding cassette domain-containing protein [Bryobacterales bacterium]